MGRRLVYWGGLSAVFAVVSAFAVPKVDLPKTVPDGPLDIRADRFEYTNGTFIASGSVTGRFERAMVRADEISGNPDTGELNAVGNIHFERDNAVWYGSELQYNFLNQQGLFGPSSFVIEPIHLSVGEIERVSTNRYALKEATFTTCPLDHPHVCARAREAELIDNETIKARGFTVYAGPVPIFYWPYLAYTIGDHPFKVRAGYGSKWGAYLQTWTTLPVTESIDSVTRVDGFTKRGVAVGQGFKWKNEAHVGEFAAYYLKDQSPYEKFDETDDVGSLIDNDRYRIHLNEIWNFSDPHYINTRWTYLSDPAVMEEFFKKEYRNGAQPESYLSYVYGNSLIGSEAFANRRLNDFYQNLDRYEYNLDLYRTKLGKLPLYLQSENSVGELDLRTSTLASTNRPALVTRGYDTVRLDSENSLYAPIRLGWLNVIPRGSYRATYYSKTDVDEGEQLRQIFGAGTEFSFQATKTLSEREYWFGRGLRHKIEPYADYGFYDARYSTGRALDEFDRAERLLREDWGTPIDDSYRLRVGLRNVLQTRRKGRLARFIDLDLFTHYNLSPEPGEENFDDLYIDARMPLTENQYLDMEGAYDWYAGKINYFTTRYSLDREDYIASLEHRYILDDYSLWTPRLELFPEQKVSAELYARYEDRGNELEEIALIGYYSHCCLRYGLGFHHRDDGDNRVMFSIALTAFPDEKISSGM
jgi:lipopolysaccharide assembly outer membrane protein LptD (OstA)